MPLRRAGTVPNTGVRYGPGSAAHRSAKSYALRCVRGTSCCRRKERQRRAIGRLEHHFYLLSDLQRAQIAIDKIGLQRGAFLQRDVADRVRPACRFTHQAERIDRALAGSLLPHRLVGKAERTDRTGKIMRLAAGSAALDQEFSLLCGFPERRGFGVALRRRIFFCFSHYTRSRMAVEAAWRTPSNPPVPCATARSQFFTCTLGCASPRNCRTASMILVMPPRLTGWLLHSPPPSVLKGSLPTPEIRLPSATNLPPSPFPQKPMSSSCIKTVMVKLS